MKNKTKGLILGLVGLMLVGNITNASSFSLSSHNTPSLDPYPQPETPSIPSQGLMVSLPIILNPQVRFYAQAEHTESLIYGVWASITTPNPAIREPVSSYAGIVIIAPDGKWIEAGVRKKSPVCIPRFVHAIQPGAPTEVLSPAPTIGVTYQYKIAKYTDGLWTLDIMEANGTVIYTTWITNAGMNVGTRLQAFGEVHSPGKLNDMGIADIKSLKWKMANDNWSYWNWWMFGVVENPPYWIGGISPDPNNNVQVSGNNGNPIPPGAPCP